MKRILCVIDLTEASARVLETAGNIASGSNAHLLVLFPYRLTDYEYRGDMTTLRQKLESEAREKFLTLKRNVPVLHSISYEFQPEIGFIFDRIISNVKKSQVDMIVIGQPQTLAINDVKGISLQSLISSSTLPFVIVPDTKNSSQSATIDSPAAVRGSIAPST
jgi:hypothetical protein